MKPSGALPYVDRKPVGAADFYFAINASFRFIRETLGDLALQSYWEDMGRTYFAPVVRRWKDSGLPAVAEYWRAFFAAEPGAQVSVHEEFDRVILDVAICPAIRHLRQSGRTIEPGFCRHCYHVSEAMAAQAGLSARVEGGNGSCRQVFGPSDLPPQRMEEIEVCQ